MAHLTDLEERIAHLTRLVEDLSDVVVEQSTRLHRTERQLALLIEREVEREGGLSAPAPADQRPPHW
jgi:SlyX protein